MVAVRSIIRRTWHALRTPWAAGALLAALAVDTYRVVDWHGPDAGSALYARGTEWMRERLGITRPWMCRLPAFPTVVAFGVLPDGSVMLVDEGMPKDARSLVVPLDASFNWYGAWTEWLDRRAFTFTFDPSTDQATRERAVRAWWTTNGRPYYARDGGITTFASDRVTVWRIVPAYVAHELGALTCIALLARASWYTAFHWRSDRRRARGGCPSCDYSREGLDAAAPCPECGAPASLGAGTSRIGSLTSTTAADSTA